MSDETPWSALDAELLLQLAGPASFERGLGYHHDGNVTAIEWIDEHVVRAVVAGTARYVTQLRADGGIIDATCTCPVGERDEFCKHAVAVGLQLLDAPTGEEEPPPARAPKRRVKQRADPIEQLRSLLRESPRDELVDALIERAQEDPRWRDRLLAQLSRHAAGAPDPAHYRSMLQRAFSVRGFLDWRQVGEWSADAYDAISTLKDLVEPRPADAIKLTEYALKRCDVVYQRIDGSGGEIATLTRLAEQIHLAACLRAEEPPVKLATRLYAIETQSELDLLSDAYTTHADALGREGQAAYRALAEADWETLRDVATDDYARRQHRRRVAAVLEQVARGERNIDGIVEYVGDGFEHSYAYVRVAQACADIDELDAALHWCTHGIAAAPTDHRLYETLTQLHTQREEHLQATEVAWRLFEGACSTRSFDRLRTCASAADAWPVWRARAFATARNLAPAHGGTPLVELHLHESEVDRAWAAAVELGCDPHTLMRVAELRESTHPADSASVYLQQIDATLETTAKHRYNQVVRLLSRADALLTGAPERALFDDAVTRVRAEHRLKRTLIAKLDARGW